MINSTDTQLTSADIFYNDKILIITTLKIAHSKCREIFLGNQHSEIHSNFIVNNLNFNLQVSHRDNNYDYQKNYDDAVLKIWNNFLKNEEKRDFIIFLRNPKQQLISSFMQDFFYLSDNIKMGEPFIDIFLNQIPFDNIEKLNFKNRLFNNGIDSTLFKDYPLLVKPIINILLEYYLTNGKYSNGHYKQWNTFIYSLYTSELLDKNKIKFIDIYDNPIELQLSHYFNEPILPKNTHDWKRHSYIFDYIDNLIITTPNFNKIVNSLLYSEFIFYNKLKNNKQNLL